MFRQDFTFTKRQLGIMMFSLGSLAALAILAVDLLDAGRQGGIGPAQSIALTTAVILAVLGALLIPLGDDAA